MFSVFGNYDYLVDHDVIAVLTVDVIIVDIADSVIFEADQLLAGEGVNEVELVVRVFECDHACQDAPGIAAVGGGELACVQDQVGGFIVSGEEKFA